MLPSAGTITVASVVLALASKRKGHGRLAAAHGGVRRIGAVLRQAKGFAEAPTATREADVASEVPEAKVAYAKSMFTDVLNVSVPRKLEVFLKVLQGSGYSILGKDEWKLVGGDVLPLVLPLATKGAFDDNLEVIGLLIRTPNGSPLSPDEYQVVTQKPRKSKIISLVALDIGRYIMKRAEEANFRKQKQDLPVIEATKDVYDVRFSGTDQTALDKWLLLEVGAFPEVYKHLAMEHLQMEDPRTGLIIADTMRDAFGANWGFPHAFVCRVLREQFNGKSQLENRDVEADHCAQRCFTGGYPLWSLEDDGTSLYDLLCEAKMPKLGSVDSLRVFYMKRSTDDQRAAVRTGSISLGCATVAKAQALMDAVCCGHKSYNGIRQELIELYEEVPGCEPLVEMINYYKI